MKAIQLLLLTITGLFATACSPDGLSTSVYYNSYGFAANPYHSRPAIAYESYSPANHHHYRPATTYVQGPQYYRTNVRSCGDNIINLSGTPIIAKDCNGRGVIIPNRW